MNFRKHYPMPNNHKNRFRRSITKITDNILDKNKYITNLSHKSLTLDQSKVLIKGLTFVPSKANDENSLKVSICRFSRMNRIKYFFRDQPENVAHPFRNKSTWMPPQANQDIEDYLERITTQITTAPKNPIHQNLSKSEILALKQLSKDSQLVIKNADKGSGIVVEDRENYIKDGLEHLSDRSIYKEISHDPTLPLTKAINSYILHMKNKGIVSNTTYNYLKFKDNQSRTQQLYFLKKIHKNPISVRPIVSGCGGPTEKISQFIDYYLQPQVPKIDSYIRDSGHLISMLEQLKLPKNCTLATIDVKALYLNIPHKEGIKAVMDRLYYNNPNSEGIPIPPSTMTDLLNIVLTKNYFQFADHMYHQIQGTAMGTKMAPAYANTFMAELEKNLLQNYTMKPILWKRYIDDILCIWPGPPSEVQTFMNYLNSIHDTIKFTYECSKTTVDFLDITIYKGNRFELQQMLDFKPFFKKTNKFQYLEYSSSHPKQTFKSLIKGELTRLLRACSDEISYEEVNIKLYKAFRDRGYPAWLINKVQLTVPYTNRPNTLVQNTTKNKQYETFLSIDYTPDLDIKEIKSILKPLPHEEEHVPKPCLSLRKTKNLKQFIVRAKLNNCSDPPKSNDNVCIPITQHLQGNSAGCATPGCKCCIAMSRKTRVISSHNNKSFSTPKHTNCRTQNIIYLLECIKCTKGNQYIGQTQRCMNARLAGHRAASRIKINLPIYKHFKTKPNHDFVKDIKITILEKTTTNSLTTRESYWISTLDTVYPKGLNSRYE